MIIFRTAIVAAIVSLSTLMTCLAQPTITRQPTDFSVSLGANLTNTVIAGGASALSYQWRFNQTELTGVTNRSLVLTNVQLTHAGGYSLIVTDSSGSVTSRVAKLEVDPTFTKITTGRVVTDGGSSWGVSWGDYDNDGLLDLLVSNEGPNFLYRNAGNGTFTRITTGPITTDPDGGAGRAWGDYDNDGDLDLFSAGFGNPHRVYRNNGNGSFTKLTRNEIGPLASAGGNGNEVSLGDYDNDGYIDLFIANQNGENELYRGSVSGQFTRITTGPIPLDGNTSLQGAWSDYDNDGDLDLLVAAHGEKFFYRNNGDATFSKLTSASVGALLAPGPAVSRLDLTSPNASGGSVDPRCGIAPAIAKLASNDSGSGGLIDQDGGHGVAWGDYDNDGDLDVFVTGHRGEVNNVPNALYRNDGNGKFERMTTNQVGSIVSGLMGNSSVWADYDNDGFLDLFVTPRGPHDNSPNKLNSLYHNNGDGTFSRVLTGSLINDVSMSWGAAWGDYDNNGFMDLAVANGGFVGGGLNNFLYQNKGNSNRWLKLKLEGTRSNRSAIGAKVRVKATIRGTALWQMREISGGDGFFSQADLRPNFGLGDATVAETVRIEWPSGIVQELHNVTANQILTVTEPARLEPGLTVTNGMVELKVKSWKGFAYGMQASSNLESWTLLTTLTNLTGTLQFADPGSANSPARFYRILVQP